MPSQSKSEGQSPPNVVVADARMGMEAIVRQEAGTTSVGLEIIAPLYIQLMEEIKRREEVVRQVLNNTISMPQMAAFEFCYLQLRKICEVFALACLTVHGDIPGVRTRLLQRTYNADQIMKRLGRIHPRFYPVPGQQKIDLVTGKPIEVIPITSGFLTKDDLINLYGECGNYLHRGSIRQLLGKWEPTLDFQKIALWIGKIITLFSHHQIQTSQANTQNGC